MAFSCKRLAKVILFFKLYDLLAFKIFTFFRFSKFVLNVKSFTSLELETFTVKLFVTYNLVSPFKDFKIDKV